MASRGAVRPLISEFIMPLEWFRPAAFVGSVVFALLGVVVFWLAFIVIDKITPYNLWEELVEKQNMALGMVVAAMSLGISLIVAAAIHG
jgi:putative membrane protein